MNYREAEWKVTFVALSCYLCCSPYITVISWCFVFILYTMPRKKNYKQREIARALMTKLRKEQSERKKEKCISVVSDESAISGDGGGLGGGGDGGTGGGERLFLPVDLAIPGTSKEGYVPVEENVSTLGGGGEGGSGVVEGRECQLTQLPRSADPSSAAAYSEIWVAYPYELDEDDIKLYLSEEEEEEEEEEHFTEEINDNSAENIVKMPAAVARKKLLQEVEVEVEEETCIAQPVLTITEKRFHKIVEAIGYCNSCWDNPLKSRRAILATMSECGSS